ncbi:MAG: hypothetical protein L6246_03390 [Thermodesulfovibrionales bacterium]|nr:hypothetical protein [Thermodesulfovibrionales bacterium]
MTDKEIEQMWKDFENVVFDEDEDGEFILSKNWKYFGKVRCARMFGAGLTNITLRALDFYQSVFV